MTTTFWLLAAVTGIVVMLAILLPSLKGQDGKRPVTVILALVIGFMLIGFVIYNQIGTPEAIDLQPIAHADNAPQSMEEDDSAWPRRWQET